MCCRTRRFPNGSRRRIHPGLLNAGSTSRPAARGKACLWAARNRGEADGKAGVRARCSALCVVGKHAACAGAREVRPFGHPFDGRQRAICALYVAFEEKLRQLGWVDGKNLATATSLAFRTAIRRLDQAARGPQEMIPAAMRVGVLGVRRVSVGGALARAAWGAFMRAARALAEQGEFDGARQHSFGRRARCVLSRRSGKTRTGMKS